MREIIVVGFAGAGGSCEGIKMATGLSPDIAINHDPVAVAVHTANHPDTMHYCQNIWRAVPTDVLRDYQRKHKLPHMPKIGLAWFSPDCKHHSKAKGGKPLEKNIRDLAWVLLCWAKLPAEQRPRVFVIENVEEFVDWGPLTRKGRPNKKRKGEYWRKFCRAFQDRGYKYDFRVNVVAANVGTPTTRKRLVAIFRDDGLPIVWNAPKFDKPSSPYVISGERKPWRTAAEIIDWSLPCPSIFDTSKQIMGAHGLCAIRPLADNTLARIARGVSRYVVESADPFIVPITHTGDSRVHSIDEPMRTLTTAQRGEHAVLTPFVTKFNRGATGHDLREPLHTITSAHSETHSGGAAPLGLVAPIVCSHYGEGKGGLVRGARVDEPLRTVTCDPRHSVAAAFLAQHNTDMVGHDVRKPLSTIVGKGCTQAVVSAGLLSLKGSDRRGGSIENPIPAITAGGFHVAETRAFVTKFHRDGGQLQGLDDPLATGGTKARFGLVEALAAAPPFGPQHERKARMVANLLRKYGLWDRRKYVTITVGGATAVIVDLGMRMFVPEELKLAMGFPRRYIIDRGLFEDGWKPVSKTAQVRLIGNAVCPQVAEDVVSANYEPMFVDRRGIPEFALEAAE